MKFCAPTGDDCFRVRCCTSASDYCYQQREPNRTAFIARCLPYGTCSGDECTILNPVMPYMTCIFETQRLPCHYVYRNTEAQQTGLGMYNGAASGSAITMLIELDLAQFIGGAFASAGSTHEVGMGPNRTAWITQQNSDVISSLEIDRAATCVEDVFRVSAHPLGAEAGAAPLGVHQMIWSGFSSTTRQWTDSSHSGAEPIAFMTLEFNNSVGVYNYETHELLRVIEIPLSCDGGATGGASGNVTSGLIPILPVDGVSRSCTAGVGGWDCFSCIDRGGTPDHPSFTSNCSRGTRPHMLAQDKHGGIWVALKTGALARLRLTHWSAPPDWFIQDLGVGALPFYVQAATGGDAIWVNSVTANNMFFVEDPQAEHPRVTRVPLQHELGFGVGPPESYTTLLSCPPQTSAHVEDSNARPGGFVVLPDGGIVATLYQRAGAVVSVTRPTDDVDAACAIREDYYPGARLFVARGCWRQHNIVPFSTAGDAASINAAPEALLHIATNPLVNSSNVTDLWLVGSSNDFARRQWGLRAEPLQQDVLYRLQGVDLAHLPPILPWAQALAAPTQGSWLHRVLFFDEGVVLATELLSDRLLAVLTDPAAFAFTRPDSEALCRARRRL